MNGRSSRARRSSSTAEFTLGQTRSGRPANEVTIEVCTCPTRHRQHLPVTADGLLERGAVEGSERDRVHRADAREDRRVTQRSSVGAPGSCESVCSSHASCSPPSAPASLPGRVVSCADDAQVAAGEHQARGCAAGGAVREVRAEQGGGHRGCRGSRGVERRGARGSAGPTRRPARMANRRCHRSAAPRSARGAAPPRRPPHAADGRRRLRRQRPHAGAGR